MHSMTRDLSWSLSVGYEGGGGAAWCLSPMSRALDGGGMPEQKDTGSDRSLPVSAGHQAKQEVGVITPG